MSEARTALHIETSFRELLATKDEFDASRGLRDLEAICADVKEVNPDLIHALGHNDPDRADVLQAAQNAREILLPPDERPKSWVERNHHKFILRANGYTAIAGRLGIQALFSVQQHTEDFLEPDPVEVDYDIYRAEQKAKGIDVPPYPLMAVVKAARVAAYAHLPEHKRPDSFESWHRQYFGNLPSLGQAAFLDDSAPYVGVTGGQFMPQVENRLLQVEDISRNVRDALEPRAEFPARGPLQGIPESWVLSGLADQVTAVTTLRELSQGEIITEIPTWSIAAMGQRLIQTGYDLN